MIDGIISSVIESASPAITKWRTSFLLLSLIFLSPELDKLFSVSLLSVDLMQSAAIFGDLLASSKVLFALVLSFFFYIFVPYINYGVLKYFTFKNIGLADPLLVKIDEIRKKKKEDIEKIIEESFDFMKERSKTSAIDIVLYKERSEIVIMSLIMYTISSLYLNVFNIYISVLLFSIYIFSSYISARKILLVYLKDVAPFKVLEDYVKYFVLVK